MLNFKRVQFVLISLFFVLNLSFAQNEIPNNNQLNLVTKLLRKQLKHWAIYSIDATTLFAQAAATNQPKIQLNLGDLSFSTTYEKTHLFSDTYTLVTAIPTAHTRAIPMHATYQGKPVRLTVNKDFLYGFFTKEDETYYIEPLWYYASDAPKNQFVVYNEKDVVPIGGKCGVTETIKRGSSITKTVDSPEADCYQVDIAIASDFLMFQDYGTVADVENHNLGVLNNVQGNYTGEFANDFLFNISTHFIVSTSASDPWTTSTAASTLLNDFLSWGNNNGFGNTDYDIAELWTDRDLDASTVGLAYVGVVCHFSHRYHILQDFTNNANFLRVMTAHEIGHNFDCSHDASNSPNIMAPTVSTATTWSNASVNAVDSHTGGLINGCLPAVSCSGAAAPVPAFTGTPTAICVGQTVNYSDNSTGNPTAWEWHFFGGTPEFFTGQNPPAITYGTAGVYNTELTVTNASGSNTLTESNFITVQDVPNADFNLSVIGHNANFFNQSSGANFYNWDFGDPASGMNTSSATNPSHTYLSDGTYTITLTAINNCGSDVYTFNLNINTPATANFTATPTTVCTGQQVQFNSTSSANTSQWSWVFQGGSPSSSNVENPLITYNTTGFFDVSLVAASPGGNDQEFKSNFIHVLQSPTPDFTFTTTGTTVNFTNTTNPLSGNTYAWDFGDGNTSTMTSPTHTFSTGGSFDVTLDVISSNCGTFSVTKTINLMAAPVSSFTANTTTGCNPQDIIFTSTATGADSWSWSFPGGTPATSTSESVTVSYPNAGIYDVTLVVTNASGSHSHTEPNFITITETPTPNFTYSASNLTVDFTNTSSPLSGNTYAWDFGDGNTSTDVNPIHTYTSANNYSVTLMVTNSCGTFSTTQTFDLAIMPISNFTATHNGCVVDMVSFFDISQNNPTSWNWSFPGGNPSTSTLQNPLVEYNTAGSYSVTLEVSNAAGTNTKTTSNYIVVEEAPTASFTSITTMNSVAFTSTSIANPTTYSWDFGDNSPLSTMENPTHIYAVDGSYDVTLTVSNSCGTHTQTQTVVITGNTPTVSITASSLTICEGESISFEAIVSANTQNVEWVFENGTPATSTVMMPTTSYLIPGTHNVLLTAYNGSISASANINVTVIPNNVPAFSVSTSGLDVNITNSSTDADTYSWDFGDSGTSTLENPTHTYLADGTYTICLTTMSGCNTSVLCKDITISGNGPVVAITTNTTNICAGMSITYHAEVTNSNQINWTFAGGTPATSTDVDVTVQYNTTGTHLTTLTGTNPSGNAIDNVQITVLPLAEAIFTSSTNGLTEVIFGYIHFWWILRPRI